MSLSKLALRRPVSMVIGICALVVFGVMSIFSFPLELTPEMEMPMMIVSVVYPGANPTDVETLVTKEVEDAVSTLSGVKTVTSTSSENSSLVLLQYQYGTDMDKAYSDLKAKLDSYTNVFPEETQTPVIIEMDMNAQDAMTLSISGEGDGNLLRTVEDNIVPEFEKLGTVASVSVSGGREEYISIELQQEQMKQYNIDMNTVVNAVSAANFTIPAGSAELGGQSLSVTAGMEYDRTEALRSIPIPLGNGNLIHLSDIADVHEALKDANGISRYNGKENITVGIQKRQSVSAVDMSREVQKAIEQINKTESNVQVAVVNDSSDMIMSSLMSVVFTLVLSILISMAILFLFFGNFKASLIVGSSIPVSLLVTFLLMKVMGFSLNTITMSSLVIGVGMMVDNSIVVLESCFRYRQGNKHGFKEAALEGAKAVSSSIIASTITTCVVFLPIALTSGLSGQMFKPLGFTIVFAMVASLISALMVVPLAFAFYKPSEKQKSPVNRIMLKVENAYGNILGKILHKKKTVVAISLALLIGSLCLVPLLDIELVPSTDEGTISLSIETKPGLTLENVDKILTQVEDVVAQHPDVERYLLTTSGSQMSMSGGGSTKASLNAYLKKDRAMSTKQVLDQWKSETRNFLDCDITMESVSSMSSMASSGANGQVEINLASPNLDTLKEAGNQVQTMIGEQEGVFKTTSSIQDGRPIAKVVIDPVKAASEGFTPYQIAGLLNMTLSGKEALTLTQDGREYSVQVEYPSGQYESVNDLSNINMTSPMGVSVPLTDVASIEFQNSPQSISRKNGQYNASISGEVLGDNASEIQATINENLANMSLPQGVSKATNFSDDMIAEEFVSLGTSLLVAILLVFMVMAMQFESPKFSIMVMICIPFSLVGSFLLMYITNSSLSMTAMLGFLMLIGTVVNNGILYVDTTNEYRKTMSIPEALILTGKTRLRPILMTTLTTVLSMIPTALAIGDGGETMQGLAIVVIGGLTASTILTLLLLPSFYLILSGKDKDKKKNKKKPKHYLDDTPELPQEEPPVPALPKYDAAPLDAESSRSEEPGRPTEAQPFLP